MKRILSVLFLLFTIVFLLPFAKTDALADGGEHNVTFVWTDENITSLDVYYWSGGRVDVGSIITSGQSIKLLDNTQYRVDMKRKSGAPAIIGELVSSNDSVSCSVDSGYPPTGFFKTIDREITLTFNCIPDTDIKGSIDVRGSTASEDSKVFVGDTLIASVTNCNASNISYSWFVDNGNGTSTVVKTGHNFTVSAKYYGKSIGVEVVDSDDSSNRKTGCLRRSFAVLGEEYTVKVKITGNGVITYDEVDYTSDFEFKAVAASQVEFLIRNGALVDLETDPSYVSIAVDGSRGRNFIMPNSDLTLKVKFTAIEDNDLSHATVVEKQTTFVYDGLPHLPVLEVTLGGRTLKSSDYSFYYQDGSYGGSQINVGTYNYKVLADSTSAYKNGFSISPFIIKANTTGKASIKSNSNVQYTGTVIKPELEVSSDLAFPMVEGRDYDILYPNAINVGTYTITVKFKGNFSGTKEVKFNIVTGKEVSALAIKEINTYTGKNIKPGVEVKNSLGTLLTAGSDYDIAYPKTSKAIGSYKIKITLKGNYEGTVYAKYTIAPKNTSVSKLTSKSKGFTIKWKKQTRLTNGYQIRYSLKKDMTSSKTITLNNNLAETYEVKKLKAKKTYYVQIRTYKTVKGKKICSDWSKVKSVKTK